METNKRRMKKNQNMMTSNSGSCSECECEKLIKFDEFLFKNLNSVCVCCCCINGNFAINYTKSLMLSKIIILLYTLL